MGKIAVRYKSVQLPSDMVEEVRQIIATRSDLGYHSVKGFVEDSVRRRIEQLRGGVTAKHEKGI